jgi:ABC-2 type transport system permease protein
MSPGAVPTVRATAGRELMEFRRGRFFPLLLGLLALVMVLSVVVAAADFRIRLADYNAYVEALRQSGSAVVPAPGQLFPLQLLRGSIEYLELLGALFAIIIGYGMIAGEKQRGTVQLVFSRPVGRFTLATGKVAALAVIWCAAVVMVFLVLAAAVVTIGTATLQPADAGRLALSAAAAWIYLMLFSCTAMGLAALCHRLGTGLVAALVLWLVVVLIIPQIGDTMDPDNQVPGGLFRSLDIAKADEKAVLAHFSAFEGARNGLEVSSVTKLFERSSFAFLGVKEEFNQQPVSTVWAAMLPYTGWLAAAFAASAGFAVLAAGKRNLLRREP